MNNLEVAFTDKGVNFFLGDIKFLRFEVNDRFDYGHRHRPKNIAVYITTYGFFINYGAEPGAHKSWKEAFECLRKLGATQVEIAQFAKIGTDRGWSDVEDVVLYSGCATLF
jgi:hypothetical protein